MIKDGKISIKNIYYMLSYAFKHLNQSKYKKIEKEEFENIHSLFATILTKGLSQYLKQGLHREYILRKESIPFVRGKINIQETINLYLSKKNMITCEYDELAENNLINKIIKTTSNILIKGGEIDNYQKHDLAKKMAFFCHIEELEVNSIKWDSIRFHHNSQLSRMLVNICQLIIEGMLSTTTKGNYKIPVFLDEQRMCRLFEKFIFEYYKKEFPSIIVRAAQIPWALDNGIGDMLPIMQSDITLSLPPQILIIDAKYYSQTTQKRYDKNTLHSRDLYQIFTYVKNKQAENAAGPLEVSGLLLYAKTDQDIQPDNVYQIEGNKISVKTLDLNQNFKNISSQLNEIVTAHFGDQKMHQKQI